MAATLALKVVPLDPAPFIRGVVVGRPSHAKALGVWMNGLQVGTWRIPSRVPWEYRIEAAWSSINANQFGKVPGVRMRKFLVPLVTLAFLAPAVAQPIRTPDPDPDPSKLTLSVPIFSQIVVFSIPRDWKPAHEARNPGHYLLEHIPGDQSIANWREMITVQGFQGLGVAPKRNAARIVVSNRVDDQVEVRSEFFCRKCL